MCGIVAGISNSNVVDQVLQGLEFLEYRGYDSAGIAFRTFDFESFKTTSRVSTLRHQVEKKSSNIAIAHTRWATHGIPSIRNCHPQTSNGINVVHNGVIENFQDFKNKLKVEHSVEFSSDTDTEVVAHLINIVERSSKSLVDAVEIVVQLLKGSFALAVVSDREPDRIVLAKNQSPLIIGISRGGYFAASDAGALTHVAHSLIYLEDGDVAEITRNGVTISNQGQLVFRPEIEFNTATVKNSLNSFSTFMEKEIHEQPEVIQKTSDAVLSQLSSLDLQLDFKKFKSVLILACGTSYNAGLLAKYWIERLARIPVAVEIASEFRYREPVILDDQLIVAVSQSGETADTLSAVKYAANENLCCDTLAVCNVDRSSLVRSCDYKLLTSAGQEIGVASTKAFTAQLVTFYLLAAFIAHKRQRLSKEKFYSLVDFVNRSAVDVNTVFSKSTKIKQLASKISEFNSCLFVGRNEEYPIAVEGSLKLKELSYIHAEAYAAGELKHGPLALVDHNMPVIALVSNSVKDKMQSNLQEIAARDGDLFVVSNSVLECEYENRLEIATVGLPAIAFTVVLQMLSLYCAQLRGNDVDKPRNLAKSVTVE